MDTEEVDMVEVDGEVGDVSAVQPMILQLLKLMMEFPKEVPNLGAMVDGVAGDESVAPLMIL